MSYARRGAGVAGNAVCAGLLLTVLNERRLRSYGRVDVIVQTEVQFKRISEKLAGQEVLVTGATGFLAKVFVEKLLRAVPEIGKLHLLVRPRADGVPAEQRVRREVFGSSAFDRLRAALGPRFDRQCREKVAVVSGDLTLERFGLDEAEYKRLTQAVTLVVNSAATVTFDERLDAAVALNIEGPRRLLQFARDCGDVPYMHVSTAYVSGVRTGDIAEELIPPGHSVASYIASSGDGSAEGSFDLDAVREHLRSLVDEVTQRCGTNKSMLRRELIKVGMDYAQQHGWNDTYTCTKWLAEQFLARDRGNVPLVLLRPAIIEGSYEEPAPGWIDGLRMADPLILAFGRGKLKEFPADASVALDFIPVDFVANAMVATLPAGLRGSSLAVYHCASSGRNPIRMMEVVDWVAEAFHRRPMRDDAGRPIRVAPMEVVSKDRFIRRWESRLRRIRRMRAFLKSTKIAARRRKRLASAEAQIAQLIYFVKIYAPYTHLNCRFVDDKLCSVLESMHPEDRESFPFDAAQIDWHDYLVHRHVAGVRHFVLGSGTELEAPMLAAGYAVEDESPDDPPPMQVLSALRGESVFEVIENAASTYPSRIALQMRRDGRWVRYTYKEVLATTAAVSRRFAEHNLRQGDHIAIYCDNCPEWGLVYLAAMRSGLTVVPLDRQLGAGDVVAMAEFADVKLICAGVNTIDALREAGDGKSGIAIVALDSVFVPPPGTSRDPGPEPATVTGDAIASIVFTSGTTLAPKGVMIRHSSFLSNARNLVHIQAVHADDQFLSVLPLHHVFEFTGGFVVPLANASTVTYVEQLVAKEILETMQATGTTVMMVVPRLLKLFHGGIMREVERSGWFVRQLFRLLGWISDRSRGEMGRALFGRVHKNFGGRLRMFVCGGSALPPSLFLAFQRLGFPVYEGYGLTETAPVLTVNPLGAPRAGSVGLPLPEVELEIRNQATSGIGELYARGPNVMAGYYKNTDATDEVLTDGWFRTGDLCRRDADGFVYVAGRAKDVIVTAAGKNVYPDEVAACYAKLPHVKELCVLAMPNADGIGDRVDLVVVLDMDDVAGLDRSAAEAEVREAVVRIGDRGPSYQRIHNIHFWTDALPRTTTLKVKRAEVVRQLLTREAGGGASARGARARWADAGATRGPVGPAEAWLRDTLADLTNRSPGQISPEAHLLLDLGIDSLMKVQVISDVETCFDMTLAEEVSARVSRVGDLLTIIGDRLPRDGKKRGDPVWKRQTRAAAAQSTRAERNGKTPVHLLPLRWALRGSVAALCNSYIRIKTLGLGNLPTKGAFVLAANHASHLDSAVVLAAIASTLRGTGRRCYIAAAQDYFFDNPVKAMIFRDLCDTIPFDRNADGIEGLQRCGDTLEQVHALLLFPEVTRSVTGEIQPFKIGAAALAIETGVPIVPVRVENTFDLFPKGNRFVKPGLVKVTIAKPIAPADVSSLDTNERYRVYRELSAEVRRQVVETRPERARHG